MQLSLDMEDRILSSYVWQQRDWCYEATIACRLWKRLESEQSILYDRIHNIRMEKMVCRSQ